MNVSDIVHGAKTIIDWIGAGAQPVSKALAQARADVCSGRLSGKSCVYNCEGYKPVESIARIIHDEIEKKAGLGLVVEGEANLHTCTCCWCWIRLKIWTPKDVILRNANPENEYPDWCWMKTETNPPQNV